MKIDDLFDLTFKTIFQRSTRSWLTIIGVVIGIAAVVALITLGDGFEVAVTSQLGFLGADLLQITSGKMSASFERSAGQSPVASTLFELPTSGVLTENDLSAIQSIYGVKAVNGVVSGSTGVRFKDEMLTTTINGVDPSEWKEIVNYDIEDGRFLTDSDTYNAVIGGAIAKEFFDNEIKVGDTITVDAFNFRVVGIIETGAGFGLQDSYVFMSKTIARKILTDLGDNIVSSIEVKVTDSENIDETEEVIAKKLRNLHHVSEGEEDFTITSSKTIQERVSSVISMITFFVTGIAGISLIVGGVGIMNTMFMSIMERTREIGIMKAVGAKSRDVLLLFVTEAGIMGFIGGMIGAGLGFLGAIGGAKILDAQMNYRLTIPITFSPEIIMLSIVFAAGVGIIAGFLPARRAAKLNPITALRYE